MTAWETVERYVAANALHVKRGWRLGDISDDYILEHAAGEIAELRAAPNDIDELADIVACLWHYAQRQGWTEAELNQAVTRKLALRFVPLERTIDACH